MSEATYTLTYTRAEMLLLAAALGYAREIMWDYAENRHDGAHPVNVDACLNACRAFGSLGDAIETLIGCVPGEIEPLDALGIY